MWAPSREKEARVRRYLVVAHQTLGSPELLEALRQQLDQGPCAFHLVVPEYHGSGLTWTEGQVRAEAARRLEEARLRFTAQGLAVTGEIGDASPVEAVANVLRRDGRNAYDGVIVSTLPHSISKWLRLDAPARIQRNSGLTVVHVVGHPVDA
jgi:hypothetical protein